MERRVPYVHHEGTGELRTNLASTIVVNKLLTVTNYLVHDMVLKRNM